MTIFAYVVEHDIGFAPNPFFGYCTLAACKPKIRNSANEGDWVVGVGGLEDVKNNPRRGRLVYAMEVEKKITFNQYWEDVRFLAKRPVMNGSLIQANGDNVYRKAGDGFVQVPCRHTHSNPSITAEHIERDTKNADAVLVSSRFVYLGDQAIDIPEHLMDGEGRHLSLDKRGTPSGKHYPRERRFDVPALQAALVDWLESLDSWGCQGDPYEWSKSPEIREALAAGAVCSDC